VIELSVRHTSPLSFECDEIDPQDFEIGSVLCFSRRRYLSGSQHLDKYNKYYLLLM